MGASHDYKQANAVLAGVPMDYTASHRPGSRAAPQEIRTISYALEEYSPYQDRNLLELDFYDAGDLMLPFGNVAESLRRVEEAAGHFYADKKFPLFIGGDHLVTYPLVKACLAKYPDLAVLHFDAHADLRASYEGEKNSHATVMHRVVNLLGPGRVYQFGVRSGTKEEFAFAGNNTVLFFDEIFPGLNRTVEALKDRPVYLTLDIDVLDPAFAPGTGTPEPGGCDSREILSAIRTAGALNVVGMDLVEILPAADQNGITAVLGAKIVREALLAFSGRRKE
jgi:agmatinase